MVMKEYVTKSYEKALGSARQQTEKCRTGRSG